MKKVLILGSSGMLGHIMTAFLSSKHDLSVIGVSRSPTPLATETLDATNFNSLEALIVKHQSDYVINCIGLLVQESASDISQAILINSYLPNYLSSLANKLKFKLIHMSTDCVFSGKEGRYSEASIRDGDDIYARTKALGEVNNHRDLTIRTSIIGPELKKEGSGLFNWFINQEHEVKGYNQAFWSGVTTLELSKAVYAFISQDVYGIYNLCPAEKISKYELLKLFSKIWDKPITIIPCFDYRIDKSLVCTRSDFEYDVPNYQAMLLELKTWMLSNSNLYSHYQI